MTIERDEPDSGHISQDIKYQRQREPEQPERNIVGWAFQQARGGALVCADTGERTFIAEAQKAASENVFSRRVDPPQLADAQPQRRDPDI
jgi:hypothetical protein